MPEPCWCAECQWTVRHLEALAALQWWAAVSLETLLGQPREPLPVNTAWAWEDDAYAG